MVTMSIGSMNKRVTIQAENLADDGAGGQVRNATTPYVDYADVWAEVIPASAGSVTYQAGTGSTIITHKVRMRYMRGISHKMRVVYGSRILEVHSVIDEGEARRYLTLLCSEVLA